MQPSIKMSGLMRNPTLKQSSIMGVLLALVLVVFSTSSFSIPNNTYTSVQTDHSVSLDVENPQSEDAPTSLYSENRLPAKSLAPNLAQLLRTGSWLPDRINNVEPKYELVIDLTSALPSAFHPHYRVSLTHWRDWTRSPPSTSYRVAGWKESNLLYRFISQSPA